MRYAVSVPVAFLAAALANPAMAQADEKPVPMDKAPFHIPVFQNDYLILLNVNIPPGRNTGYHIHYADSISVNLMPGSQTNQNYGSSEVSAPGTGGEGAPGRATFTNVSKNGPRTHKASNVGPTPFHNISFIFKKAGPDGNMVSDRTGVSGFTQIMDNARVRAWRVILEPGQSTGQITQSAPGLRVYVHGGVLAEVIPGNADRARDGPLRRRLPLDGRRGSAQHQEHRHDAPRIHRIRAEVIRCRSFAANRRGASFLQVKYDAVVFHPIAD